MSDSFDEKSKKLQEPFSPLDVEWRLQSCGEKNNKFWAKCLCYVTNRAIMQRLDEVVGAANWKNEYSHAPEGGVLCGISIRIGNEWVTKYDGAENTAVESVKGGLSDSMKRAAVQWGIGRYLYKLDAGWAVINDAGINSNKTKEGKWFKWDAPRLPAWALPFNKEGDKLAESINKAENIAALQRVWALIPPDLKPSYLSLKDKRKAEIEQGVK